MNPTRGTRTYGGKTTASRFNSNPGLVGGSVMRGGTVAPPRDEKSRISSPQQGETILPSAGLFVGPMTWVDGEPYDETTLNQQIITNVDQILHPLVTLTEDFQISASGIWELIPGLAFPLAAGVWTITAAVFYMATASYWYSWISLPAGATLAGQTIHQNSNPVAEVGNWIDNGQPNGFYQASETVAQGVMMCETHDMTIIVPTSGTATWGAYTNSGTGLIIKTGTTIMGVKIV